MWVFCHNRIHFKCMLKYDFVAEESIASKFTMFVMLCVFVQKTVSNQTNKSLHIFVSSLKTPTFFTCFSFLYFDVFLHHLDFTHAHFVHTQIEDIYWILFDSIHIFFSFFLSLSSLLIDNVITMMKNNKTQTHTIFSIWPWKHSKNHSNVICTRFHYTRMSIGSLPLCGFWLLLLLLSICLFVCLFDSVECANMSVCV